MVLTGIYVVHMLQFGISIRTSRTFVCLESSGGMYMMRHFSNEALNNMGERFSRGILYMVLGVLWKTYKDTAQDSRSINITLPVVNQLGRVLIQLRKNSDKS